MNEKLNKYSYVAKDIDGKKIKGTYIAQNEKFVVDSLAKANLYVVKIKKANTNAPNAFFSLTGKVSLKEITSFCKQFSVLISSGISIIDAISTLKEQSYSSLLKKTLDKVVDDLYQGMMLSESMRKYPKIFPNFLASMIYVGETSGKLSEVLISVANYYTREQKNKQKLKSALAYPLVLVGMLVVVLIALFHFVIPTFISAFSKMEIEMPAITMALFNISNFFKNNWQYVALCIVIIAFSIYLIAKTKNGKYFFDKCKFIFPISKKINTAIFTSQFVESLGLLLSSGLDIVSALESIRTIIHNTYLAKQFDRVIIDVKKGISLSNALELEMNLGSVVTQMVAVGEKTGKTDKMLLETSSYFDEQVTNSLSLISTIIQPILLALLGVVIAVVFVAIYSPILSMITSLDV